MEEDHIIDWMERFGFSNAFGYMEDGGKAAAKSTVFRKTASADSSEADGERTDRK